MLIPKCVKYRKMHRGRRTGIATQGATVAFGDFGLQAMEACWMSNRQIEAARRAMTRHVKRGGQIWIRVFPDKSITKKPAETRMGSGKGNPEGWVAVVKPGRVLFEMGGVTPQVAKEAMKLAAAEPRKRNPNDRYSNPIRNNRAARPAQGPAGLRDRGQDEQDGHRPDRLVQGAPSLPQDGPAAHPLQGPRREERVRGGRPRPHHRNASDLQGEALART